MKFEERLKRLDEIVQNLEAGQMELEEMISLYEEGIGLVRTCEKFLKNTETRLEKLAGDPEDTEKGETDE